jgi:hypothetical protein
MVCFTELRNCIIHNEGSTYSNSKFKKRLDSLKELRNNGFIELKEIQGMKRIRYNVIIKDKSFLIKSVEKIDNFLHELDKVLKPYY